jgi:hypothetical protein
MEVSTSRPDKRFDFYYAEIAAAISSYLDERDPEHLLRVDPEQYLDELVEVASWQPLEWDEGGMALEEVKGTSTRHSRRGRRPSAPAHSFRLRIPVSPHPDREEYLRHAPSVRIVRLPEPDWEFEGNTLLIDLPKPTAEAVNEALETVRFWLGKRNEDIERGNATLRERIRPVWEMRRRRLEEERGKRQALAAEVNIPWVSAAEAKDPGEIGRSEMQLFGRMLNDTVTLVKQDGQRFENIRANVQPKRIFIFDVSLPIEEGDRIIRTLPNGLPESYLVLDRGYHEAPQRRGMPGIPPHYQVEVRKESRPTLGAPSSAVYNLYGANPRVNIQSHDASLNVVNVSSENLFAELRKVIEENVPDVQQKADLLGHVDQMEKAKGTPGFTERYKAFVAVIADHFTLIQPFLPALTQLLPS